MAKMGAMTNSIAPHRAAALPPELLALAPIGEKRRPVKLVEPPAFRAARTRLDVTRRWTSAG
jgi:hypothetical protein